MTSGRTLQLQWCYSMLRGRVYIFFCLLSSSLSSALVSGSERPSILVSALRLCMCGYVLVSAGVQMISMQTTKTFLANTTNHAS